MRRRKGGGLSKDDLELWKHATRATKPLKPKHFVITNAPSAPAMHDKQDNNTAKPNHVPQVQPRPSTTPQIQIQPLASASPRMDHATHRRMMRGKLSPQTKIDLHEKTMAKAQPALIAFILKAYKNGQRLVLVITGKGKNTDESAFIAGGVLRRAVPHWLRMPPLAPLILDVAQAHPRHGGAGAYYVYLKRGRS